MHSYLVPGLMLALSVIIVGSSRPSLVSGCLAGAAIGILGTTL